MARREYVSFLGEHRDLGYLNRGPDPVKWLWGITGVVLLAISVWWFGFRDADEVVRSERVLEDITIPTLLLPVSAGGDDLVDDVSADLECLNLVEEWSTFQGGNDRQGCVTTRRIETPKILWRSEVGLAGWLNNPVISNGAVFVGSAGVAQFSGDRADGIYSFDLVTGTPRWVYTTELDVNAVSVSGDVVMATGDEGRIWAISASDGTLLWTDDLQVGVFGSPLILSEMVIIGAGDGSVTAYLLKSGERVWQQSVNGPVRGGPSSDGQRIYVAGETHEVLALNLQGQQVWRVDVLARGAGANEARIFAAPTITDTMVILSLVRTDVFAEPALVSLDKNTGEVLWRSEDQAGLKPQWANIRSSPAVAGQYLVFGEGYSDELVVLDLATGETRWSAKVGPFCYPHWPSVAITSGYAYLARHDGGLYAVDLQAQEAEPVWSIYLGQADGTGAFPAAHKCDWGPDTGYSILASPAISPEGVVVIGTLEGRLLAIGDADW
jgi:outer membrane protein assembly factor BamB